MLWVDFVSSFRPEIYLLLKCPVSVKLLRMRITENSTFSCGSLQTRFLVCTVLLGGLWSHRIEMYFVDKCDGSFQQIEIEPIWLEFYLRLILISIPSEYCELDYACLTAENIPIQKMIQGLTRVLKPFLYQTVVSSWNKDGHALLSVSEYAMMVE